jgi:hypothetical protein
MVREVSKQTSWVFKAQQQARFLWETYFSSVENIVYTTVEIIKERVYRDKAGGRRSAGAWNVPPGGLVVGRTGAKRTPWDKDVTVGGFEIMKSNVQYFLFFFRLEVQY